MFFFKLIFDVTDPEQVHMNQIMNFLYLGNLFASRNKEALSKAGVGVGTGSFKDAFR